MAHFPALAPGVRVTGVQVTVTLSDGSRHTVDIPAEYRPDDLAVDLVQHTGPGRREVSVNVTAGYLPAPAGRPRSLYRTG